MIGNEVLAYLENMARNAGISVVIGIISGDNGSSIKLFEKNGYEKYGHFKQIGEKFNKILDVVYYQKILLKSNRPYPADIKHQDQQQE